MSDKKGLAKHCEYLESKIRKKQFKLDELRTRLKQSEEVIDEIYDYIQDIIDSPVKYATKNNVEAIFKIVQKYKGDNK